jgi:ATP-dependent DNA helicase RecG
MRSNQLSTNSLKLHDSIEKLFRSNTKTAEKLLAANLNSIEDLLWVFPRKVIKLPPVAQFYHMKVGEYFRGSGKVLSIQSKPNFKAHGKGRAMLFNIGATIQDAQSEQVLSLRWFNCYSSMQKKIESIKEIEFLGIVSEFNGVAQISNPDFNAAGESESNGEDLLISYPTINTVAPHHLKKVMDKIPMAVFETIEEVLPKEVIEKNSLLKRSETFKILHGRINPQEWDSDLYKKALDRLVYEEFFIDQIKIDLRRQSRNKTDCPKTIIEDLELTESYKLYPYQLTEDQSLSMKDIAVDLSSGHPMMRMIQGDVGCGKTTIAVLTAYLIIKKGYQAALMCPTEALATQHFQSVKEVLPQNINISLLLGSHTKKEKEDIQSKLLSGEIDFIIGTHSLFQDSVSFKNLGLSIIDEQHKFGVEQRIKLLKKSVLPHCLIMSATPIPRSLSLTQYGDLDLSIIKTMPGGRKGSQTRIVTPQTYQKFLSFLKTRVEMGEQAYIVVPAINESETMDINNLNSVLEIYKKYFPQFRIASLHGQMKADEKADVFEKFGKHEVDILIATSVIEVGINVLNSTVMAIINPERFGLSSLHQMRGRVGRGEKPGFCFLVTDKKLAPESMHRLQVIEKHHDGFKIAEEDLKIRGEGDLFGVEQSGSITQKRLANIITHQDILYKVINDFKTYRDSQTVKGLTSKISADEKIFTTI